uniref:Transmembrane protein n=1 Tax=Glossina brevipalpis TaxID=37001 RepID=A0A1A9W809_9MUSC
MSVKVRPCDGKRKLRTHTFIHHAKSKRLFVATFTSSCNSADGDNDWRMRNGLAKIITGFFFFITLYVYKHQQQQPQQLHNIKLASKGTVNSNLTHDNCNPPKSACLILSIYYIKN